jgi:integrase
VVPKPELHWKPKDRDIGEEDIVLKKAFIERMAGRMERMGRKPDDLIFPQRTQDKPDMHLIRYVQDLAERAGIPEGKIIDLHSIWRTFGSMVAKTYGLEQAMVWLGHSNIETTQAYIATEEMTTEESRKKVTDIFSEYDQFDKEDKE